MKRVYGVPACMTKDQLRHRNAFLERRVKVLEKRAALMEFAARVNMETIRMMAYEAKTLRTWNDKLLSKEPVRDYHVEDEYG